ncbi:hypothetical protein [Inquilinus limosus]
MIVIPCALRREVLQRARDLGAVIEEIPVLRRITPCCAAPGMTGR